MAERTASHPALVVPRPTRPTPRLILTRTPLRISLAGGGTDLPAFYERDYGAVFSTAIDNYIYVTVKPHSRPWHGPMPQRVNAMS